jgi:paired amphipathic helix protein Sin3a
MDNIIEKPDAYAVSMEPTFTSYLQNEFLSNSSGKKELQDIVLQRYIEFQYFSHLTLITYNSKSFFVCRNMRGYNGLDDLAVACKAMEGVQVINGLECKMSCSSYKISYVLDTEDFFHRKKKQKKSNNLSLAKLSQNRIARFHKFLSASR